MTHVGDSCFGLMSKVLGCHALIHSNPLSMRWHSLGFKLCRYFHPMWHGIILSCDLFLDSQVAFVTKYLVNDFMLVVESLYHIWLYLYYNWDQNFKDNNCTPILNGDV